MIKTESEWCQECGACCAYFRVNCEPKEIKNSVFLQENTVKMYFFSKTSYLRGTERFKHRCDFLEGEVSEKVLCTVYQDRPQVCRDFHIVQNGKINSRCTKARAHHGLPALSLDIVKN